MTNLISTVFRKKKLLTSTRPPQVLARSFPLIPAISIAGDSVQLLGFDLFGSLTLACNLYMISVRRARVLPLASFRFPVAGDTLAFGCILPTAGRIRDLHPLERALAGRTKKKARSFKRASKIDPAVSYSPTQSPVQYHRRC